MGRPDDKVAVIVGAGQTPGDTIGNGEGARNYYINVENIKNFVILYR